MRRMKRPAGLLLVILTLTLAAFLVGAAPARAQPPAALTARAIFDVNIRATPGVNAAVLGVLPPGSDAALQGRTPENNWLQVEFSGTTGWVAAWLVVCSDNTLLLPVTTDIQPPPLATGEPVTAISPYTVNVRAEPSSVGAVLARLVYGTEAVATGRSADSSWVRVQYDGVEGWVAAWLVILRSDINGLPIDGSAIPTPVNAPTATPRVPAGSTPAPPQPTPIPGTPASPTGVTILTPYRVNIRSAPTVTAPVLEIMPADAQAAVVGRNASNNWLQVQYGEALGWVAKWVVVATDSTVGVPVRSDIVEVAPLPPNATITGSSIYTVVMRAGPDLNFGPLAEIPARTQVPLLARTPDSAWLKVNYQGTEGWVAAWVMLASVDYNSLPEQQP